MLPRAKMQILGSGDSIAQKLSKMVKGFIEVGNAVTHKGGITTA